MKKRMRSWWFDNGEWVVPLLVLSFFVFMGTRTAEAKDYWPEEEITDVKLTFKFFDTQREMQLAIRKAGICKLCDNTLEGLSQCRRDVEFNYASCTIWAVRPKRIDDTNTLTIGHEVLHGVYGQFHRRIR